MLRVALWLAAFLIAPSRALASTSECVAAQGSAPIVSGIEIQEYPSDDAQLKLLRVTAHQGAFMHIYFNDNSEADARRYAACLGTQLYMLIEELLDDRQNNQWASVVFTDDPNYVPPRAQEIKTRWVILTSPMALEGQRPRPMVIKTIPHEQVHDFQSRNGATAPRWFVEGHATWAGLRVTHLLDPEEAELEREKWLAELRTVGGPVNLAAWGGLVVKGEAILRQVSADDRARMETDPNFSPTGSFTFTTNDFVADETMASARYAAALLIFEGLERRHGADKVRRWVLDVTSTSDDVTRDELAASVKKHFQEDLTELMNH